LVKKTENEIYIVETKGLEDLDAPPKMAALKQWRKDVNKSQKKSKFNFVFVDEEGFNKYEPRSFDDVLRTFKEYK
jgi:type III restriction enzyme